MLQNGVKTLVSSCNHLAPVFGLLASVIDDLVFSSPEPDPSSENKYSCITSIKIPLSAFLFLRKEKIVVNIPHTVVFFSFKSLLSQKVLRMKILGFPVLVLGVFLYFSHF